MVFQWYVDITSDKRNWPILLEHIEVQIALSEDLYNKLKPEMKKVFISYANDVTNLKTVLDFHNVFLKLKSPMMDELTRKRRKIVKKTSLSENNNINKINKTSGDKCNI